LSLRLTTSKDTYARQPLVYAIVDAEAANTNAAVPLQPDTPAVPLQADAPAVPLQPDAPAVQLQQDTYIDGALGLSRPSEHIKGSIGECDKIAKALKGLSSEHSALRCHVFAIIEPRDLINLRLERVC
jgi:hypothetical protein